MSEEFDSEAASKEELCAVSIRESCVFGIHQRNYCVLVVYYIVNYERIFSVDRTLSCSGLITVFVYCESCWTCAVGQSTFSVELTDFVLDDSHTM